MAFANLSTHLVGMGRFAAAIAMAERTLQRDPLVHYASFLRGWCLPYARRLAAILGGALRAESTVGEGSTFTLRLPAS